MIELKDNLHVASATDGKAVDQWASGFLRSNRLIIHWLKEMAIVNE